MEITEEILLDELYRNLSRRDCPLGSSPDPTFPRPSSATGSGRENAVDLTSDGDFRHWRPSEVRPPEDDLLKEAWPLSPEDTAKEFELYLEDIGVRI